jgi:pseudouridine-5'-phosphate glycosidase
MVVCAGAKAILDLPATLEYLETHGVPVVGYQTNEFPAFYSRESGLQTSARADSPEEVVLMAQLHWDLGLSSALLVAAPPPVEVALAQESVKEAIDQALKEARRGRIRGQAVTPFLLQRVSELTDRESLSTNLGLLRNNARLAGKFASSLMRGPRPNQL